MKLTAALKIEHDDDDDGDVGDDDDGGDGNVGDGDAGEDHGDVTGSTSHFD